jgi:hypothetical protein
MLFYRQHNPVLVLEEVAVAETAVVVAVMVK